MKYVQALKQNYSDVVVPDNDIWNVPDEDQPFEIEHGRFPFASIIKLRGLAMTPGGKIFGMRSLTDMREDGYVMRGRVSIEGKKYPAFTTDRIFCNSSGKLINVAILYVCNIDPTNAEPPRLD
jgi:hypothetical protein